MDNSQHAKRYAWLRHHWLEIVAVSESGGSLRLVAHDEAGIGDEDDAARLDRAIDAAIEKTAHFTKATGSTHE